MSLIDRATNEWSRVLWWVFALFIVCLPLFEAPKTVFLLLFLALAAVALAQKPWIWRWQKSDSLIVLWTISGFIVAAFSALDGKQWAGATSLMWLGWLFLWVKKLPINARQRWILQHVVLASTLVATLHGLWRLWVTQQDRLLELNSVGHVNHSAIYLALNFGLALAMLMSYASSSKPWLKTWLWVCVLSTAAAIVIASSRTTVMVMVVIALSFAVCWYRRNPKILTTMLLVISVSAAGLYALKVPVVEKYKAEAPTATQSGLGERKAIWNSALLIWRHAPIFGLGIKNFSLATLDLQKQWLQEEGRDYVEGDYLPFAHAHNLYLSLLAEQGSFGLLVTLALLMVIGVQLWRYRPQADAPADSWCLWLAALAALEVVVLNGLFNTTLHHEHGMLSVVLIGWWWQTKDQVV